MCEEVQPSIYNTDCNISCLFRPFVVDIVNFVVSMPEGTFSEIDDRGVWKFAGVMTL